METYFRFRLFKIEACQRFEAWRGVIRPPLRVCMKGVQVIDSSYVREEEKAEEMALWLGCSELANNKETGCDT